MGGTVPTEIYEKSPVNLIAVFSRLNPRYPPEPLNGYSGFITIILKCVER
jgi:hypothetical protein